MSENGRAEGEKRGKRGKRGKQTRLQSMAAGIHPSRRPVATKQTRGQEEKPHAHAHKVGRETRGKRQSSNRSGLAADVCLPGHRGCVCLLAQENVREREGAGGFCLRAMRPLKRPTTKSDDQSKRATTSNQSNPFHDLNSTQHQSIPIQSNPIQSIPIQSNP